MRLVISIIAAITSLGIPAIATELESANLQMHDKIYKACKDLGPQTEFDLENAAQQCVLHALASIRRVADAKTEKWHSENPDLRGSELTEKLDSTWTMHFEMGRLAALSAAKGCLSAVRKQ